MWLQHFFWVSARVLVAFVRRVTKVRSNNYNAIQIELLLLVGGIDTAKE
jgi:hypothetical protein